MNIDLMKMMRSARTCESGARSRGHAQGRHDLPQDRNNVGIPKEDFLALLEDLGNELAEELPGFTVAY